MLIRLKNPLKSPFSINFTAFRSNDLIELMSFSKIPVIRAIVPPDTPGITLAAPIPIPLKKSEIDSRNCIKTKEL